MRSFIPFLRVKEELAVLAFELLPITLVTLIVLLAPPIYTTAC